MGQLSSYFQLCLPKFGRIIFTVLRSDFSRSGVLKNFCLSAANTAPVQTQQKKLFYWLLRRLVSLVALLVKNWDDICGV